MKLGIVCPYDYFRDGGVQSVVREEYRILKSKGYDVKVIAPRPTDKKVKQQKDVILLGTCSSVKMNAPFHTEWDMSTASKEEVVEELAKHDFDLLHVHEPWLPVMPYQVIRNTDVTVVGTLHATWPESTINNSIQKVITPYVKPALERLDYITAVSESPAEKIIEMTDKHINYIPNGINLEDFDPTTTKTTKKYEDGVPTIFYLGRLEKRKGVDLLLKAFNQMRKNNNQRVRLLIAGAGQKEKSLKEYVERFEVPDVEFLGRVTEEEKKSLLKTCTLYCTPAAFGESFGIVLLEAMAMGAPIVAGYNSGYKAVMQGVGQLAMVDTRNTEEFARRLEVVINSPEVREMLVHWGNNEVQQYEYEKVIDQYHELFQEILKTKDQG